jgi:hypothetical protein
MSTGARWVRPLGLLAISLCSALILLPSHAAAGRGEWVWSPGLCKSRIEHYGVRINDGRTFSVSKAFCAGYGGLQHCQWSSAAHLKRLYDKFYVVARSFDGTVRVMDMYTSGETSYEVERIRAIGHESSYDAFYDAAQRIMYQIARDQQRLGCAQAPSE